MRTEAIDRLRRDAQRPVTVQNELLTTEAAALESESSDQSLQVLSALGGVLSTLLFVLFFWSVGVLNDPLIALLTGAVLVGVTIVLGRTRRQAFLATTTVTGYMLGCTLIMIGLPESYGDVVVIVPVLLIAAITLILTRNYYLIFLATASVPLCLIYLHLVLDHAAWTWAALLLGVAVLAYAASFEYRHLHDRRFRPVRSGAAFAFLVTLVWFRWAEYITGDGYGTATVLPLFIGCSYLLLVSFRNQHLFGLSLSVAGLGYFTAQYYYDLRWDLLDKSIGLMLAGTLLLIAYGFLHLRQKRSDA